MATGNLILNPGADGTAGGGGEPTPVISGWTTLEGAAAVVRYGASSGYPTPSDPGPGDRGANFFGGGTSALSRIGQEITLPGTAAIDQGRARFDTGGWLGGWSTQDDGVRLSVEFLSAAGQPVGVVVLGPVTAGERGNVTRLVERRATGTVPPGSRRARVLLTFTRAGGTANDGYADSLWLKLSVPGPNLITNPGAETNGTGIPGWTILEGAAVVIPYGTSGYPSPTGPGPADRGVNFFGGGNSPRSRIGQDITLPDLSGTVEYTLGGWLGGYSSQEDSAQATAQFRGATGQVLGTATIGPVTAAQRGNTTGLVQRTTTGTVPAGSRTAHLEITFVRSGGTSNDGYADSLSLTLETGGTL